MQTLNLLVVDDEPGMRLGVQRALRDFSVELPDLEDQVRFEVTQAGSAEDALASISKAPPDIILLDYKLPGLSGLDILEEITVSKGILTIMITAYASLDAAVKATKQGAYDFMAKPFTPDELRITLRKAARHLLLQRQARRLTEEKRRVRFEFISVLAHELKAPIGAIQGYLKIIKNRSIGDDQQTYDHMLSRSLIRLDGMHKLIMDLLDLTRIESGQKRREFSSINVMELAAESAESFIPAAKEKNITIKTHGDSSLSMMADRGELLIIFNNLISNAVKYNRDGGRVDITVDLGDGFVRIAVADTGIGIAPDKLGLLFEEFSRIRSKETRDILGSGLGLSIVKKLASLYGGQVQVTSESNVGTTFTVTVNQSVLTQQEPVSQNNNS